MPVWFEFILFSPRLNFDHFLSIYKVIFFDEAHKLWVVSQDFFYILLLIIYDASPALIQSTETMKCLLDSMLVLTKQDRLCHVIHATSDPFYQTWLRQLNVMQHCKVRSFLQGVSRRNT